MSEDIYLADGPMQPREARGLAVVIGAQKGVKVRHVQDEEERARLQASERNGHVWRIGEPYYAMADIRAKKA